MITSSLWPRVMVILGLVGMLFGAVDPLEGSLVILPSVGLVALGAFVGKSRFRTLLFWSLALVAIGVAAMFVLSWFGGVGGKSGHSMWWAVVILPYPVGWIGGLVGAVLSLVELFRHPAQPTAAA